MTTGHDVARKAVRLWQQVHPGESLKDQCQRYAGYYFLWAGFGHERGIAGYGSAIEAYRASKIESKDPAKAPPGAMHYFDIGKYGHIGAALGSGLMAHTSALGDTIENLGSHVKISTVASYPHKYLGWSKANGTKPSLVGKLSDANKQPLAPNQRHTKNYVVAGRAYANLRDDAIALVMPPNTLLTVKSWRVGDTTHSEKRFLLTTYQGKQVYVHLGDVTPQNVEGIPAMYPEKTEPGPNEPEDTTPSEPVDPTDPGADEPDTEEPPVTTPDPEPSIERPNVNPKDYTVDTKPARTALSALRNLLNPTVRMYIYAAYGLIGLAVGVWQTWLVATDQLAPWFFAGIVAVYAYLGTFVAVLAAPNTNTDDET